MLIGRNKEVRWSDGFCCGATDAILPRRRRFALSEPLGR